MGSCAIVILHFGDRPDPFEVAGKTDSGNTGTRAKEGRFRPFGRSPLVLVLSHSESSTELDAEIEYEHEHRCAEHEQDLQEPAILDLSHSIRGRTLK